MLKKLTILNGDLSVKFDPLNTRYTVNMNTNDKKLELEYEVEEGNNVSIFNNHSEEGRNEIVVTVYNDEEMMSYYLEVFQNTSSIVTNSEDYFASLEVKGKEDIPEYVAPTIASICFLIILLSFTFLFKKKKKCK